jgi:hypothetical protein
MVLCSVAAHTQSGCVCDRFQLAQGAGMLCAVATVRLLPIRGTPKVQPGRNVAGWVLQRALAMVAVALLCATGFAGLLHSWQLWASKCVVRAVLYVQPVIT